jgi:hypothetical protein
MNSGRCETSSGKRRSHHSFFVSERGGPFTTDSFNWMIKRAGQKISIPFQVHSHMAAPRSRLQAGWSPYTINPGLPWAQEHPAHRALRRAVADQVQRFFGATSARDRSLPNRKLTRVIICRAFGHSDQIIKSEHAGTDRLRKKTERPAFRHRHWTRPPPACPGMGEGRFSLMQCLFMPTDDRNGLAHVNCRRDLFGRLVRSQVSAVFFPEPVGKIRCAGRSAAATTPCHHLPRIKTIRLNSRVRARRDRYFLRETTPGLRDRAIPLSLEDPPVVVEGVIDQRREHRFIRRIHPFSFTLATGRTVPARNHKQGE